ncbi:MAG: Na+/H+ antiporter subunit E [bacterium]|nr:Na+/H+ antiporter subunit E [bacterium]
MAIATITLTLAIIWIAVRGEISAAQIAVGLVLALTVVGFLRKTYHQELSFRRPMNIAIYVISFLKELTIANIQVLRIVLSPGPIRIRPGIIAYHTRCKTPLGVTALANSITLTPGTLSVDVSTDASTIFVHTLDIDHPDEVRKAIRRGLENPIIKAIE